MNNLFYLLKPPPLPHFPSEYLDPPIARETIPLGFAT